MAALLFLQLSSAQNVYQSILEHRAWMTEHYPKPGSLSDEALFEEAAFAISYELREPEALELLEYVAREVPQLYNYTAWVRSNKPDLRHEAHISGLKALADAAQVKLGRYNTATAWCRYLYSENFAMMQNAVSLIDEIIDDQQQLVLRNPSKENRALLCIMKLSRIDDRQWETFNDDPDDYDELMQTEQEALRIYPVDDETVDRTRAYLYYLLAKMKGGITNYQEASLVERTYDYINEPIYTLLPYGYMSNAEFYFQKATELFVELYTEAHPMAVQVCMLQHRFFSNNYPADADFIEQADRLRLYADYYYPENSLPRLQAQVDLWFYKLLNGQRNVDAFKIKSVREAFEACLGNLNYFYMQIVMRLVYLAAVDYPRGAPDLLDYFNALAHVRYHQEPLKYAYLLNTQYSVLKDAFPQQAASYLAEAVTLYRQHHDAGTLSISFGRRMALDYHNGMGNYPLAAELQGLVCQDVKQHYGEASEIYWQDEHSRLISMSFYERDSLHTIFPRDIEKMEQYGVDPTGTLQLYASYEGGEKNYALSEKLYRQTIDRLEAKCDTVGLIHSLLQIVNLTGYTGDDAHERENTFHRAESLLNQLSDSLRLNTYNFVLAATYLTETGRYTDAVAMLDRGLNLHELQNTGLNPTFVSLTTFKNHILTTYLHDIITARRLMAKQVQWLQSAMQSYTTPEMIDYLWHCYYLEKQWGDQLQAMGYLMQIVVAVNNLAIQQGDDNLLDSSNSNPLILINHGIPLLNELISIFSQSLYYIQIADTPDAPKEIQEQSKQYKQLYDNFQTQLEEGLHTIVDGFPNYDADYKNNYAYLTTIKALCSYYLSLKRDNTEAEKYLKETVELTRENPEESFNTYISLGDFYLQIERKKEARAAYAEADKALRRISNKTIYQQLTLDFAFCRLYYATKEYEQLLPYARNTFARIRELQNGNFLLMTETEQENFMSQYGDPAGWLTSLLEHMPEQLAGEVYDAVLYRTGMQLRSQQHTKTAILDSGDDELIGLLQRLNKLQSERKMVEYVNWSGTPQNTDQNNEAWKRRNDISFEINTLEQQLIERSEPYRNQHRIDVTWKQVRDRLQPHEAAVEFVYADEHLVALLLRSDSRQPTVVPLVEVKTLVDALQQLGTRTSAGMATKLYNERSVDLYGMLWQPMEQVLEGIETVYFSTPGILNNLSFAAFATPDGAYLFDRYNLCQLSTTAKLLRGRNESAPASSLLMGSILYSDRQERYVQDTEAASCELNYELALDDFSDDNRVVAQEHFKYLPFTANEIADLEKALKPFSKTTVRLGKAATEQEFRELIGKHPQVIHLATHGFFVANIWDAAKIPFFQRYQQALDNSMQRAGVVLADAERSWMGQDEQDEQNDGILTANEVSKLNLQETQLVVLSACETALGDYSFEGIFGLPRGFMQAGAQSLLVSLWSVNDKSTALFMSEFYQAWLGGASKHDAMKQAVGEVRKRYPQPFYWAPFILLDSF